MVLTVGLRDMASGRSARRGVSARICDSFFALLGAHWTALPGQSAAVDFLDSARFLVFNGTIDLLVCAMQSMSPRKVPLVHLAFLGQFRLGNFSRLEGIIQDIDSISYLVLLAP